MGTRSVRRGSFLLAAMLAAGAAWVASPAPVAAWERSLTISFYNSGGYGDGKGRVTSDDGAIDCSYDAGVTTGDCSEPYIFPDFLAEYDATLTLTPATGSYVCLSTTSLCQPNGATQTFPIHFERGTAGNLTMNPSFNLRVFRVQVEVTGPGSVSGNGAFCPVGGNIDYCGEFKYGASAQLTATPAAGSNFALWPEGPCYGQDVTCSFTVTGPQTFAALFGYWRLVLEATEGGQVCAMYFPSFEHAGCAVGGLGTSQYWVPDGSDFWVEGQKYPDTHFVRWNTDGPCSGQEAVCEFTIGSDVLIKGFFAEDATPKPTTKPSAKPAVSPAASTAPTTGPSAGASQAPGSAAPTTAASPAASESASGSPGATGEPARPTASPPTAGSSDLPATPGAGGAAGTDPVVPILLVVVAGLTLGLGFVIGTRRRRPASPIR